MIIDPDDWRIKFVPVEEAIVPPPGLIEHLQDYHWVVHPERGLVFWVIRKHHSPQCNRDRSITASFCEKMYPWAEVRQIPSVFRQINVNDYCDR